MQCMECADKCLKCGYLSVETGDGECYVCGFKRPGKTEVVDAAFRVLARQEPEQVLEAAYCLVDLTEMDPEDREKVQQAIREAQQATGEVMT